MKKRTDWLPTRLADLIEMFQNILVKIDGQAPVLGLTPAQVTRIKLICEECIAVCNYVAQARATTESLVEWRENIFYGTPTGKDAPPPPEYPTYAAVGGSFIGIITEFRELRELIVALPNYTRAIGEDLMIVAVEGAELPENETAPELKVSTEGGYQVNVAGSMQGFKAMRVDYQRSGSSQWNQAAFLIKLPGKFAITPATPGQPESGQIRAIFIDDNEPYGNYSPSYPLTISS